MSLKHLIALADKLILHDPRVPNEYMVMFADDVTDVCGESHALAARYGGQVLDVWGAGLHGCVLRIPDARARLLAGEGSVCYVEQNAISHVARLGSSLGRPASGR